MTRREILRTTAALTSGSCLCLALNGTHKRICCITPELESDSVKFGANTISIDLNKAISLSETGSSANIIDVQRDVDIIIVHCDERRYAVLSGLCTHFPRPLTYIPSRRVLQCNNFNHSIFDLEGRVVKGPAREPIRRYRAVLRGNHLEITL